MLQCSRHTLQGGDGVLHLGRRIRLPPLLMFSGQRLSDDREAVNMDSSPESPARRERAFKVVIRFTARADLRRIEQYIAGRQAEAPHEALQVLDIVVRTSRMADLSSRRTWGVGDLSVMEWRAGAGFIRPSGLLRWDCR